MKKSTGEKEKTGHSSLRVFKKIVSFFLFLLIAAFVIYLSGYPEDDPIVADSTIKDVYGNYPGVEILPPDWVYLAWLVAGVYLLLWLFWDISLICRKPEDGKGYLYNRPPFIPTLVYTTFIFSLLCVGGWAALWLLEEMKWASLSIGVGAFMAIAATGFAVYGLNKHVEKMKKNGHRGLVIHDRVLVQNSLGFYAAWLLIVGVLNIAIAMVYEWDETNLLTTTILLASLGGVNLVVFILDILVFSKAMRYLITPYMMLTIYLGSLIEYSESWPERNYLLHLFMFGLAAFTTLFKFASMISHACKKEHKPKPKHKKPKDKKKLLKPDSSSDEFTTTTDEDSEEQVDDSDEEAAKYIKQAQLLLVKKH